MKQLEMIECKKATNKSQIEQVEQELGLKLPEAYKEFLLKHNGGRPVKDSYPIIEIFDFNRYGWGISTISDCGVDWFYGIYDGEYNNLVKENKFKIEDMPDSLVGIGCAPGGDEICIGVKTNNFGKVYYWGHDWEKGEEYVSFVLVANSFEDFINSLYKAGFEDDPATGKPIKWINTHDRYSLPYSTHTKEHDDKITGFFAQAPAEVDDFVIEDIEANGDIILHYDVKSEGKRYIREMDKSGNTISERVESI